jgi:hypothetical protein
LFRNIISYPSVEGNLSMPEKRVSEAKCSDGSSIPIMNWCDRTFDCIDFTDELSCQNSSKGLRRVFHYLKHDTVVLKLSFYGVYVQITFEQ